MFCVFYIDTVSVKPITTNNMDGYLTKLVNFVSGVPQGSVSGPLLFLLFTSEFFSNLENNLTGYTDEATLIVVVPSPGVRVTVTESLIRVLGRVSEFCDIWGIKLNATMKLHETFI